MTLPVLPRPRLRSFQAVDRFLRRRWVQVVLFALVFAAAWLAGMRTAQAAGAEPAHLAAFSN
jgi:hypothetical protein